MSSAETRPSADLSTPTIATIAAGLGVSVPTVSKVLNGRSDVAPSTRATVEAELRRTGYRRRRGPVAAGSPPLIDVVFHELGSAWAMEIVRGVEHAAAEAGVGMVLSALGGRHNPEQGWVDRVLARRPRGVILVMSTLHPDQRHQLERRPSSPAG